MTTSGTTAFAPPITTLIKQAWICTDLIMEEEDPTAAMYEEGLFKANTMVKAWEAIGLHVWTQEEYVQFLQPSQAKYVLGGTTADKSSDADSWARLTLAQPAITGATTIVLQTAAFVTDGMNVGVILSSGVTFWTTADGAPTGETVTLADALPSAASSGNYVLAYPSSATAPRSLKIPKARLLTLSSYTEIPMTVMSRQEYEDLPQKTTAPGTPTQFFYSPRRDQGFLYVWSVANTSAWAVRFTGYRSLQDFVDPTNTADFPQEWAAAIMWNLALEFCPGKSVPQETYTRIQERAAHYYDLLTSYDRDSEPISFGLDGWLNQDD